jgi:hypothetical protein
MKTRTWMLIGALLAIPTLGWVDEPAKPATSWSPGAAPAVVAAPPAEKAALNLQAVEVQKIIRNVAKKQIETAPLASGALLFDQPRTAELGEQVTIPFRAPRRAHHMNCDSFNCVAYTADNYALYTIPRDQYYDVANDGKNGEGWLACQSHDNLLSTFERYDKCRGISVGLPPVGFGNVTLDLPKLRL